MGWEQRMIERGRQREKERDKGGYKERRKEKGRREQNWIEKGSSKRAGKEAQKGSHSNHTLNFTAKQLCNLVRIPRDRH